MERERWSEFCELEMCHQLGISHRPNGSISLSGRRFHGKDGNDDGNDDENVEEWDVGKEHSRDVGKR